MGVRWRGLLGCGAPGKSETDQGPRPRGDSSSLQPRSDQSCRRARAHQGQALRVAAKDAASLDRPCARRLRDLVAGTEECSRRGPNQRMAARREQDHGADARRIPMRRSKGRLFAEQIELRRIVIAFGRDGLVVTAYLGKVAGFELQGKVHQRVRDVSGGFIGNGVFG